MDLVTECVKIILHNCKFFVFGLFFTDALLYYRCLLVYLFATIFYETYSCIPFDHEDGSLVMFIEWTRVKEDVSSIHMIK